MPLFGEFPMLDIGSADNHARYLARYNYRYYCVSCIRNIEAVKKLEKCVHCSGSNLILLMEREVKESAPWQERLLRLLKRVSTPEQRIAFGKPKEEMPTR